MFKQIFQVETVWTRKLIQTYLQSKNIYCFVSNEQGFPVPIGKKLPASNSSNHSASFHLVLWETVKPKVLPSPWWVTWIFKAAKGLRGFATRLNSLLVYPASMLLKNFMLCLSKSSDAESDGACFFLSSQNYKFKVTFEFVIPNTSEKASVIVTLYHSLEHSFKLPIFVNNRNHIVRLTYSVPNSYSLQFCLSRKIILLLQFLKSIIQEHALKVQTLSR